MAVLMKINGNSPSQLIELNDKETVIGRLPECSVVLDKLGVSRKHAIIRREGDGYVLVDNESRNFTFLNHRQIPAKLPHPLKQADRISICDVELVFYTTPPDIAEPSSGIDVYDGPEESTLHTLDASSADLSYTVHPEIKLKAIIEISRSLSSNLKLDAVAPKLLETLIDIFPQAERAFLVLLKEGSDKNAIRQTYHKARPARPNRAGKTTLGKPTGDEARMSISRTIMNNVLNGKKAVLSQDAGQDLNLPTSASIADLRIRSFMCAPLLTPDGQVLGILQLDTTDRERFDQKDLDILVSVAAQAAISIQNASLLEGLLNRERMERDLRLAEQVQRRFLPQSVPTCEGYEFFAHYAATYKVGGDYYDFVPLSPNRLGLALGDVAGKGITAALMMAKFSGDTRFCMLAESNPAPAGDRLNDILCNAGLDERFITLCLGVLELAERKLTFISAGHLPILVRRNNGEVEEFGQEISGFPLGIMPNSQYAEMSITLEPGEVAIIYSDGVTDGCNTRGEYYDTRDNPRLKRKLAASVGGADAVGRALVQEVREFAEGSYQADDITLIAFGPLAR
jgi:serine phosphatase RsbU (regulator of sigma subunit)